MIEKILVSILFFSLSNTGFSADTLKLNLDDALTIAQKQSPAILIARYDSLAAEGDWRVAKGNYYPQIGYTQYSPELSERIDEQFVWDPDEEKEKFLQVPSGDLRWLGRINIDQDLPWGATLNLSSRLYRREWYWTIEEKKEEFKEYSLLNRVALDQPLFSGNPVRRSQKINVISYKTSLINYEIQKREVIYSITKAFFGLLSAEGNFEIAAQDLMLGKNSEELAARKLKAGLIPEVELLQIQVDVIRREGNYRQAENALIMSRENLCLSLGLPTDTFIRIDFQGNPEDLGFDEEIDLSGDLLELQSSRLKLEQQELQTNSEIWSERISASLQAYYELDTRRENINDLTESGDRNVGLSVRVDIPIFGFGTTNGRIQSLRASLKRTQLNIKDQESRLNADLKRAQRDLDLARDRIRIAAAAQDLSERSHQITEERFENGLVNSRELLDSQLDLTRVKREALNAQTDYLLAKAYLKRTAPR